MCEGLDNLHCVQAQVNWCQQCSSNFMFETPQGLGRADKWQLYTLGRVKEQISEYVILETACIIASGVLDAAGNLQVT